MTKSILLILIIFFCFNLNFAQTNKLKFHRLPTGISSNFVTSIYQDKHGFMWFGTNNGLNRFDGYNFTVFEHNPADPNSIAKSAIIHIYEDNNGGLWLCTEGRGLNYFDRKTGKFKLYVAGNDDTHLGSSIVRAAKEDDQGFLWIAHSNGLDSYHFKTGKFAHYTIAQPEANYQGGDTQTILDITPNYIWLTTVKGGLARFDKKTKKFTHFTQGNTGLKENFIRASCKSKQKGKYWLGYRSNGIALISIVNDQIIIEKQYANEPQNPQSIIGNDIKSLCEDSEGNLWIGAENAGVSVLNPQTGIAKNYQHHNNDEFSLANNSPWAIYEDSFQNVWIGTFNQGVNVVYNKYYSKFEHFFQKGGEVNSLVNNNVSCFAEINETEILIGTDGGGVSLWNKAKDKFTNFTQDSPIPQKLSGNAILSSIKDSQGKVWFGTWEKGVNIYNPDNQSFTVYNKQNKGLASNTHFSFNNAKNGHLYMCAWENTLEVFDIKTQKILWSKNFSEGAKYFYRIIEDKKGNVWIATANGLVFISAKDLHTKGDFKVYAKKENDSLSLNDSNVNEVFEDSNGNIWVGTVSGLCKYLPQKDGFKTYLRKDGLINEDIRGIIEDKQGNIWITTGKGVSNFNPKTEKFENYLKEDGLQGDEFSRWAIFRTSKGEILMGGTNGFNIFEPTKLQKNPYKPKIYLVGFKLFNKPIKVGDKNSPLTQSIETTQEITLHHTQSVFTIEYVALNYTRPERNVYAYKLEGLEKDWNYVGNKREATYTSLPAGEYTFQLKASNNDGVWSDNILQLKIIILPPWWETWWFRVLVFSVVISAIIFVFIWRTKAIKAQNIRLEKLVEERTFELKEKNDEVLQQAEELYQQAEELKTQRDYIQGQNMQLAEQNKVVQEKNRQIRQSINAAQTIQQAILPHEDKLKRLLNDFFVFYQPKDVVSGDFYWLTKIDNRVILAVADCTGHGVPGAFMTLIGNSLLDKIVKSFKITQPAEILSHLHSDVFDTLKQKYNGNNYGMDAIVISITPTEKNTSLIEFAGAKNSIFYLNSQKPSQITEIKGSRKAIGGQQNENINFENHTFELPKDSLLYLGSDGYIDQNNLQRKRFGSDNFIQLIIQNAHLPLSEQRLIFEQTINAYSQGTLQRDDILLLSIKI
jgi:ligand-binding sensor domain-containing protein